MKNGLKPVLEGSLEKFLLPGEPKLSEAVNYRGQTKALRKIAVDMFGVDAVCQMTDSDVCEHVQKYFAVVSVQGEKVNLVPRDKYYDYAQLVVPICR